MSTIKTEEAIYKDIDGRFCAGDSNTAASMHYLKKIGKNNHGDINITGTGMTSAEMNFQTHSRV